MACFCTIVIFITKRIAILLQFEIKIPNCKNVATRFVINIKTCSGNDILNIFTDRCVYVMSYEDKSPYCTKAGHMPAWNHRFILRTLDQNTRYKHHFDTSMKLITFCNIITTRVVSKYSNCNKSWNPFRNNYSNLYHKLHPRLYSLTIQYGDKEIPIQSRSCVALDFVIPFLYPLNMKMILKWY